jgi:NodT family efflux transporter outer membrane factor (OMF) lipoprotein
MRLAKSATVTLIAVAITGCTVGPDYHSPKMKLPQSFTVAPTTQPTTAIATTQPAQQPVDLSRWWESLNDPQLNSLIDRAIAANLDLRIAVNRLQEAREIEAVTTGESLPDAEFSAGAGRGTGTNSTKGRVSPPLNAATNTTGLHEITQVLGFDASWEVDLFGQLRRQAQAVAADTQAAAEFRNQVLVTLIADVARNYIDMRSLQVRVDLTRQSIAVQQRTADFARVRYQRGLANELDAVLAERELATAQSTLAPFEAQLAESKRAIAVLLGEFPEQLDAELHAAQPMPTPPDEVASGLPGELLRRRPDIRQSEAQLIAANARIGVETANLYPQLLLTAGGGVQGQGLGREPITWSGIWSAGPAVRWSLLDFGTTDAAIAAQDFRTREMLDQYRKTVITAVEEVDNALTNYNAQRSRLADLSRALHAADRAFTLANQRYDRGLTDFLNVLDAQRQLFALQDQYAVSEDATVTQFIAVCKSLGGGWEDQTRTAPLPTLRPAILAAGADIFTPSHGPLDRQGP